MLVNALRAHLAEFGHVAPRAMTSAELVALVEKRFAETGMPAVAQPRSPA